MHGTQLLPEADQVNNLAVEILFSRLSVVAYLIILPDLLIILCI